MATFTEVGARLGLDTKPFENALARTSGPLREFRNRALKNMDVGDAGRTLATALGLNIQNIGETIARHVTGWTKDVEAGFERMQAAGERATKALEATIAGRNSPQQNRTRLAREAAKLNRELGGLNRRGDEQILTGGLGGVEMAKRGLTPEEQARREEIKARLQEIQQESDAIKRGIDKEKRAKEDAHTQEFARTRDAREQQEEKNRLALMGLRQQRAEIIKQIQLDQTMEGSKEGQLQREKRLLRIAENREKVGALNKQIADQQTKAAKDAADHAERMARAQERVRDATTKAAQAFISLNENKSERSRLTLEEVAEGAPGVKQADMLKARRVQKLEDDAKRQRAAGLFRQSEDSTNRALGLRKSLGNVLKGGDADPLAGAKKTFEDSLKELQEINKKLEPTAVK